LLVAVAGNGAVIEVRGEQHQQALAGLDAQARGGRVQFELRRRRAELDPALFGVTFADRGRQLRLEREGIITNAGRQGFEVEEIDAQIVRDVYQAREAIEGYAARLVAERGDATTLGWLQERLEAEGAEQASMESAYEANRRAHRAVVEATSNQYLVDLFDAVWGRAIALRLYADLYAALHRGSPIAHSHRSLWEALASGDGQRAHDEMIGHIRHGLAQQISALESADQPAPISG